MDRITRPLLLIGAAVFLALTLAILSADSGAQCISTTGADDCGEAPPAGYGERRTDFVGELHIRDPSIYAHGDNPEGDAPPYIEDCVAGQVGGSYYTTQTYDTVIGEGCNGGIRTWARVVINWDEHNPPQLELARRTCELASCVMGYVQWVAVNDQNNPVRFAAMRAMLQADQTNHGFPSYVQWWVTGTDGAPRWAASLNPNGGITLHPGGEPVCELAGLSNAEQGDTLWLDESTGSPRLMLQLRKTSPVMPCQSVQVWPDAGTNIVTPSPTPVPTIQPVVTPAPSPKPTP